jgi:hypothetical protein
MTTVIPKGAGRKAHNERTNRAAQRTPLPPKGSRGPTGLSKTGTARVIADEAAKQVAAKVNNGSKPAKPVKPAKAAKPDKYQPVHSPKVESLLDTIKAAGWNSMTSQDEHRRTCVEATRGKERVVVWFTAADTMEFDPMPTYYRPDGSAVKLRNVSAAKKQLALPEDARPVKTAVTKIVGRRAAVVAEQPEEPRRRLPFDPETASDAEVLKAVDGAILVWRSGRDAQVEHAHAVPNSKQLRVQDHPDGIGPAARIIHFVSVEGGFRAVRLDRLLRIKPPTPEQAAKAAKVLASLGMTTRMPKEQ